MKKITALRGKLLYCVIPFLLLVAAIYLFSTESHPVSTNGAFRSSSVFGIISAITEG